MAKVEGVYNCEYCNHEFQWEVQLRQRVSNVRLPDVDEIRKGYVHPLSSFHNNETLIKLKCRCPKCDKMLNFEYSLK